MKCKHIRSNLKYVYALMHINITLYHFETMVFVQHMAQLTARHMNDTSTTVFWKCCQSLHVMSNESAVCVFASRRSCWNAIFFYGSLDIYLFLYWPLKDIVRVRTLVLPEHRNQKKGPVFCTTVNWVMNIFCVYKMELL